MIDAAWIIGQLRKAAIADAQALPPDDTLGIAVQLAAAQAYEIAESVVRKQRTKLPQIYEAPFDGDLGWSDEAPKAVEHPEPPEHGSLWRHVDGWLAVADLTLDGRVIVHVVEGGYSAWPLDRFYRRFTYEADSILADRPHNPTPT